MVGGDPPFFGCFSGARIKRVSVLFSDTVRPNVPNTSTIVVIILVNPSWDLDTTPASSAHSIPQTALRARSNGVPAPTPAFSTRYTRSFRMVSSSLKRSRTTRIAAAKKMLNSSGDSTHPCINSCVNLEPFREFPVVHAHPSLHAVMELADNCDHLLRDTGSGQHVPQQLSVDRIVSLLEVNEAHVQRYSPPSRQFLKSTHCEQHVDGGSFRPEAALFAW